MGDCWIVPTQLNNHFFAQVKCFNYRKRLSISIWPIDGTQTYITTPSHSGRGNNGNKGVFHIPQSSRTEISPSVGLVSYPGYLLWGSYLSTELQSVYSTAPADWTEERIAYYHHQVMLEAQIPLTLSLSLSLSLYILSTITLSKNTVLKN